MQLRISEILLTEPFGFSKIRTQHEHRGENGEGWRARTEDPNGARALATSLRKAFEGPETRAWQASARRGGEAHRRPEADRGDA
jgi:hypothetical protein